MRKVVGKPQVLLELSKHVDNCFYGSEILSRNWRREINLGINPLQNVNLNSNWWRLFCQCLTHLVPLAGWPESEPALLNRSPSSSALLPKCHTKHKCLEQKLEYVTKRKPWLFKGEPLWPCALVSPWKYQVGKQKSKLHSWNEFSACQELLSVNPWPLLQEKITFSVSSLGCYGLRGGAAVARAPGGCGTDKVSLRASGRAGFSRQFILVA